MRQPSPCVRALCETGVLFHMSHLKLHFTLHTWQSSHSTLHTSHCTLHTAPFAVNTSLHTVLLRLHTSHFTFRTSQSTLHTALFALQTSHFTVHTSHFTVHTSHFSLLPSRSKLHTALFTPNTSHCTLHTPHFISAELFSPYPSSALLISSLLICHLSFHESLPSTTTKELAWSCMRSAPARPVRACFVRSCCSVVVQEHDLRASPVQCNVKKTLSSHITLHPSHFTSELFSSGFMSSHMSAMFFLAIFMSPERSSNFLMRWSSTSLRHHFPSSPRPRVTTSLRHHFPSSPLPFVTTSLRHHCP